VHSRRVANRQARDPEGLKREYIWPCDGYCSVSVDGQHTDAGKRVLSAYLTFNFDLGEASRLHRTKQPLTSIWIFASILYLLRDNLHHRQERRSEFIHSPIAINFRQISKMLEFGNHHATVTTQLMLTNEHRECSFSISYDSSPFPHSILYMRIYVFKLRNIVELSSLVCHANN